MGKLRRQFTYNLRPGLTKVVGYAAIGSGGTVATDSTTSTPGFTLVRTSKGRYTATFDDKYLGLVGFNSGLKLSAFAAEGYQAFLVSEDVDGAQTAVIRVNDAYGEYEDPIDSVLFLEFAMKTSEQG